MIEKQRCCQDLSTFASDVTPFARMIALGFYDGPTSGLVECAVCGMEYQFDMLDWDEDHEIRIFRLARLPGGTFDQAVAALARVEEPRWPVWVPFARTRPADNLRAAVDKQLKAILDQSEPAEWVIAWSGYGERIIGAKKMAVHDLANVSDWFSRDHTGKKRDWFGGLGLAKAEVS